MHTLISPFSPSPSKAEIYRSIVSELSANDRLSPVTEGQVASWIESCVKFGSDLLPWRTYTGDRFVKLLEGQAVPPGPKRRMRRMKWNDVTLGGIGGTGPQVP